MKNLVCLAAFVACAYHFSHRSAGSQNLDLWNQERRQAEDRLQGEWRAYQTCVNWPLAGCAKARAANAAIVQGQYTQLINARETAIRILQQKPGALTVPEEQRLSLYNDFFRRMKQGQPSYEEMP